MDFRTALRKLAQSGKLSAKQSAVIANLPAVSKHPILWQKLEKHVGDIYTHMTGQKVGANFDWGKALQWLIDNGPALAKLIISLVAIFA